MCEVLSTEQDWTYNERLEVHSVCQEEVIWIQ